MLFLKNRRIFMFLALLLAVGQVSAGGSYFSQAKQKAVHARDWSARTARSSYNKARKKAQNAYAFAYQKARAAYEKAKEHKKLVIGAAYLLFEAVGHWQGWRTPFKRLFVIPGELDAANANNVNLNNNVANLTGQLNTANTNNANLNVQLNTANADIANLNNNVKHLAGQLNVVNIHNDDLDNTVDVHLANIATLNNNVKHLAGQLNVVNIHNDDLDNTVDAHLANIANLNDQLDIVNGINATRAELLNIANAKDMNRVGQLNNANARNTGLQNTINGHLANIDHLANELNDARSNIADLNNDLYGARKVTIPALKEQVKNAQAVILRLEDTLATVKDEMAAINEEYDFDTEKLEQDKQALQEKINALNLQITQSEQDAQLKTENQQRKLDNAYERGKAALLSEQQYNAINATIDGVSQELQNNQNVPIDAVRLISTLVEQKKILDHCQHLALFAYQNQQSVPFNVDQKNEQLDHMIKQISDCVFSDVIRGAKWIKAKNKEPFAGMTEQNWDANFSVAYDSACNIFAQLNNKLNQLGWILKAGNVDRIIRRALGNDGDRDKDIEQTLSNIVTHSYKEMVRLSAQRDIQNNIFVTSYDDLFNLYMHSVVAEFACSSYERFWLMYVAAPDGLAECNALKNSIDTLKSTLWANRVPVIANANSDGHRNEAIIENAYALADSFCGLSTRIMLEKTNILNNSEVENLNLSNFFSNSESSQKIALNEELSQEKKDWMAYSMNASSEITLSQFQENYFKNFEQEKEDSFNNLDASVSMDSSMNASSKISLSQLEKEFLKSTSSFANSLMVSSLLPSFIEKSDNKENETNLTESVKQWADDANLSSSFVSANKWAKAQEELAQSRTFNNRERLSRFPDFKMYAMKASANLGQNTNPRVTNNQLADSINNVSDILNNGRENKSRNSASPRATANDVNNVPSYGYNTLINELGDSTSSSTFGSPTASAVDVSQNENGSNSNWFDTAITDFSQVQDKK